MLNITVSDTYYDIIIAYYKRKNMNILLILQKYSHNS